MSANLENVASASSGGTTASARAEARFPFAMALCRVGAEAAGKAELARLRPQVRPAFMRPGLLTWKCEPPLTLDETAAISASVVFLRGFAASLGSVRSAAEVAQRLRALGDSGRTLPPSPLLQVFVREGRAGDDRQETETGDADPRVALATEAIVAALPDLRLRSGTAQRAGELVIDVVLAPRRDQEGLADGAVVVEHRAAEQDEEPWLLGLHRHHAGRSPHPGGRPVLHLPPDAPSRAWLKLEEGLLWSGLPFQAGQVAVEIGAAPGGASFALLQRGLTVVGVDPGEMDPRVMTQSRFTHLKTTLADLRREALPPRVDWLLLDVNLAPPVALHALRRVVSTLRSTLRGALLTLKLNDWGMASQVPRWLEQVAAMGFEKVRATQLCSNRQEICVAAQRRIR